MMSYCKVAISTELIKVVSPGIAKFLFLTKNGRTLIFEDIPKINNELDVSVELQGDVQCNDFSMATLVTLPQW